jgi:hypothetical protein
MEMASLIISICGVLATIAIAIYIFKLTDKTTKKITNHLVALIVNSSPNPKILQRLLDDVEKSGEWRGTIEQVPDTGNYRIAWRITPSPAKLTIKTYPPDVVIGKNNKDKSA